MMEVKQNTAVDLNDLLTSSKNTSAEEVDSAVISGLSERTHDLVDCDLIKANDKIAKVADISNGNVDGMTSLINEVEVESNLKVTVNSGLEDVLLVEGHVLPKLTTNSEPESSTNEDDILADKVETSSSTTSSSNVRDPGDDLDTLLSKINDIVEDCIDTENENTECLQKESLDESVILVEGAMDNDGDLLKLEKNTTVKNKQFADVRKEQQLNGENGDILNIKTNAIFSDGIISEPLVINIEEDDKESSLIKKTSETQAELLAANNCDNSSEKDRKKIKESNTEAIQDNEITSNSKEILDVIKASSNIVNNIDKTSTVNVIDTSKMNIHQQKVDESKTTEIQNKGPREQTKTWENPINEESDDEIVFYVDKSPEKKQFKKMEGNPMSTDELADAEKENRAAKDISEENTPKKTVAEDDEVVLLLDDDEEVDKLKKEKRNNNVAAAKNQGDHKQSEDRVSAEISCDAEKAKDMNEDNSDNACDNFVTEKTSDEEKIDADKSDIAETHDETNSNCSSSSNLLQEAKSVENTVDEPTLEEGENEEEDDDGDVEVIENELKENEAPEKVEDCDLAPPSKRIRLSEDNEQFSKTVECNNEAKACDSSNTMSKKIFESENASDTTTNLKRAHEEEADEKSNDSKVSNEGSNKKLRTDAIETNVNQTENAWEVKDKLKIVDTTITSEKKASIKAVPSYQPIPLYPPPKFEVLKSEPPLSLEFLKKFRKSFDNMSKQDLEELVLQKVVEAIIHRSEFSEMRELIEKQEKLITAHRSKISELSKQFRDLEMVHNRVVKDIEQRNSQFIMPVKITRAVGLQVYIPNKKSMADTASSSSSSITSNVPSSPQRPVISQASSTNSPLNSTQRSFIPSQTDALTQRAGTVVPISSSNAGNVRRGCVQKITPTRPVPGANPTPSSVPTINSTAYRNTSNHSAAVQPRILNKNATTSVNANTLQRSRYLSPNQEGQRLPSQQQISRPPNMSANSQRGSANIVAQSKTSPNVATVAQRRSDPIPPVVATNSTSSIVDNYINTLTHLTGGNTAVSITPAKPKEKAVIDLTDEDETPQQVPGGPATQMPVTQVPRRSLAVQNNPNSQIQYGRAAPPLARIPPVNQIANNKSRQMSSMQSQKNNSFTSISTPPGTSITRINVPTNAPNIHRVKYSHPAPLPATPPQAFNPAWKLPPPRPTIRISNLDNGIVISWTMEESMDRHAECVSYQIYAYQETSGPPMVDSWRHVGDVKAMLLPMAVTLTQFQEGQRYYFAVRAVDCHQRFGPFSLPKTWS